MCIRDRDKEYPIKTYRYEKYLKYFVISKHH
jgi:hypothetical protein